ncbi:hypothetical protein F4561_002325 [Lipingzhangella halophila]|uniref:DNA helicase n=1 Tax=Lipingzhangella halophila TaxID=1783352 RepID=A0A7W7RGK7_9ACTN|nr:cory-CC-star protein [Lipingzhangella halophila]MBB4931505.1 hypothetical protein [Lipingzhangella halophila]
MTDDGGGHAARERPGRVCRLLDAWRRFEAFHEAVFASRWRRSLRREAQTQADTMRALVLLETLGVENPVAYETLDLIPAMVADLHEWHQRMGDAEYGNPEVCC